MEFKIFLTDLTKYNEGEFCGEWIDVFDIVNECDDLDECIAKSLNLIGIDIKDPNHDEWFITDYETNLELDVGEYESLKSIFDFARRVLDADTRDVNVINCVLRSSSCGLDIDLDKVDDVMVLSVDGGINDLSDLGYAVAEMNGVFNDCQEIFERYFDFEAYGRDFDLKVNGFFEDGCYYYMLW